MRSALRGRWGRVTFYRDARDMRDDQDFGVSSESGFSGLWDFQDWVGSVNNL